MLFRDWWRIETPCGHVELELDDAGGALNDERELDETNNVLDTLTYGIENRDPRITRAIVEVYAQAHPEQFPPGLALSSLAVRDVDPLRPAMLRYLEQQVAVGRIRLYEVDIILAKIDVLEPLKYVPQPVVPEKTTFIGFRIVDQDDEPVRNSRLRIRLPDGDVRDTRTNSDGEVEIKGFALDGRAKLELLDHFDAVPDSGGEEEGEPNLDEKEIAIQMLDESGTPLVDLAMVFTANGLQETRRTDGDGIVKHRVAADSVDVSVESMKALAEAIATNRSGRSASKH